MTNVKLPKKAKVIKGSWKEKGYGHVWCEIEAIHYVSEPYAKMSLIHPKFGGFAWVYVKECELA